MKNISKQYLAGFFDGEGSVSWKKGYSRQKRRFKLQVCQKDPLVLQLIQKSFGGWIESGGKKGISIWVICGKKAKIIAYMLLPYLIVKKVKVKEMLKEKE